MEALLICPSPRRTMAALTREAPLAAVPVMGRSLIEFWLCHLASANVKDVWILANDRPTQIEEVVGGGRRWGLQAEVLPVETELSPAQALLKLGSLGEAALPNNRVAVLDHFPGLGHYPLFTSYAAWFEALEAWIPHANTPDRVCLREVAPRVWADSSARISPGAELAGPCWISHNVVIETGSVIGPGAIIEQGAFIERDASVVRTYVGPDTFVGRYTEVLQGIALGSTLIDWRTGTEIEADDFMLCALRQRKARQGTWISRFKELYSHKPGARPAV